MASLKDLAKRLKDYLTPQTGGLATAGRNLWQKQVSVPTPVANTANFVQQGKQRVSTAIKTNPTDFFNPYSQNNIAKLQQANPIKPLNAPFQVAGNYLGNYYVQPMVDLPKNVGQTFGKNKTLAERGMGALGIAQAGLSFIPDPFQDTVFPAINYGLGAMASKQRGGNNLANVKAGFQSLSGEQPAGLGDALTTNPTGQAIGNIAQIPLMIFGGMKLSKRKQFNQDFLKNINEVDAVINASRWMDKMSPSQSINTMNGSDKVVAKFLPELLKDKSFKEIKARDPIRYYRIIGDALQDIKSKILNPPQMGGSVVQPKNGPEALLDASKKAEGLTPEVRGVTKMSPQSTTLPQQPLTPTKVSQVLPSRDIINPKEELVNLYRQAGDKFGEAHYQTLSEMEVAQAGKRAKYGTTNSTFPQWVPEGLRDRKLFDKVMANVMNPENIISPRPNTKEAMLQNIVLDRIESQAGIDGRAIRDVLDTPVAKQVKPENIKITGPVYNAEPSSKNIKIKNIQLEKKLANQDYKEWQSQLFKDTITPNQNLNRQIKTVGETIKQNTLPGGVRADDLKDISGFKAYTKDVYRNFKDVYGNKYGNIKRTLLDPFDEAKGNLTKSYKNWANRINKEIEIDLGIKKGSKESSATQLFGEGKLTREQLVSQFGEKKANNIIQADTWFRKEYDKLLNEVNGVMARIYPNNPEKIIPRRNDYYRHFKEMGEGISGLLNIFDSPSNISSSLAGTSEFVRPKSKWLSFAQKRLGDKSDTDAVGGFLDYIKAAEYNKNIDPFTNQFRKLAEDLAIQTENNPKLNGFIEYLNDFANDLAGKTNPADRFIQKIIPGGRKTMSAINWLNSRIKANVILGNLSSSIAQVFNVPQGIAEAGGANSAKGLALTIKNIFKETTPIKKSNFILERYGSGIFDKFDRSIIGNAKKGAIWITQVLDEVGTKYIWNSQYAKAIAENISNPIKYADDVTRKMVAGRGIGEVPLIQKSKIFQLAAPFQLEVGNLWHVMGDWVGEKQFGKLATFFLLSHVFNKGAEAIRGSNVSFDPIQASIDAYNTYSQEEDKGMGLLKAGGRLTGEVLSNIPLAQTAAAAYPEYGFKIGDTQLPTREEFFGKGDPTRFGSGLLVTKGLQDPLFKILPPFGGQQIKRTIEGIKTTQKGYSDSATGRVRFPVETDPLRNIQRAAFGEYSTPAARNYFDNDTNVLGEKQSQTFKDLQKESPAKAKEYYQSIIDNRAKDNIIEKEKETLKSSGTGAIESETGVYLIKQDDGTVDTIDISKEIEEPKYTGNAAIDKKLKSAYKGKLTTRGNNIVKLFEAGLITLEQATALMDEVEIKYNGTSTSGSKKGKKAKSTNVTIKKTTVKTPNFTKTSFKNPPAIKFSPPPIKASVYKPKNIKISKKTPKKISVKGFKNTLAVSNKLV